MTSYYFKSSYQFSESLYPIYVSKPTLTEQLVHSKLDNQPHHTNFISIPHYNNNFKIQAFHKKSSSLSNSNNFLINYQDQEPVFTKSHQIDRKIQIKDSPNYTQIPSKISKSNQYVHQFLSYSSTSDDDLKNNLNSISSSYSQSLLNYSSDDFESIIDSSSFIPLSSSINKGRSNSAISKPISPKLPFKSQTKVSLDNSSYKSYNSSSMLDSLNTNNFQINYPSKSLTNSTYEDKSFETENFKYDSDNFQSPNQIFQEEFSQIHTNVNQSKTSIHNVLQENPSEIQTIKTHWQKEEVLTESNEIIQKKNSKILQFEQLSPANSPNQKEWKQIYPENKTLIFELQNQESLEIIKSTNS
jgi:hypothetical protein